MYNPKSISKPAGARLVCELVCVGCVRVSVVCHRSINILNSRVCVCECVSESEWGYPHPYELSTNRSISPITWLYIVLFDLEFDKTLPSAHILPTYRPALMRGRVSVCVSVCESVSSVSVREWRGEPTERSPRVGVWGAAMCASCAWCVLECEVSAHIDCASRRTRRFGLLLRADKFGVKNTRRLYFTPNFRSTRIEGSFATSQQLKPDLKYLSDFR